MRFGRKDLLVGSWDHMQQFQQLPSTNLSPPSTMPAPVPSLQFRQRQVIRQELLKRRLKEFLMHDSLVFKASAGFVALVAAILLTVCGRAQQAFLLLCKLHRADWLPLANARVERLVREAAAQATPGSSHVQAISALYQEHFERLAPTPDTARFWKDPGRLLSSLAFVLKSPNLGEKGVLLLQYSWTFPFFVRHFDIHRVAAQYHLVLEPDWSGYCDINILSYCRFPFPVFVQAFEPRDAAFVTRTDSNLIVVPTSTNWWVDHRLFRPLPGTVKDFDVIMVAAWSDYKRHFQFFRGLARLRQAGHRLQVLLLGYPGGRTKNDILRQAAFCKVADQLEIHEWEPYAQVNDAVNRAKVNVIWSRKEGVNRAIIEGMFAGVPCIMREGFNYGYRYPYINPTTGCFASERDLPAKLLSMIQSSHRLSPRDWVIANMSCQRATTILTEIIGKTAASRGEPWQGGLAVKVNKLSAMAYWDPGDADRFEPDYNFLRTTLR
jgi:glycosyltransferase involved in cell wall biosynthesis